MANSTRIDIVSGLSGLAMEDWLIQLEEVAEEHGSYTHLGKHHASTLIDAGPKLLVTFEHAENLIARAKDAEPYGFHFARHEGWSHLGVYATQESWFRDPYIYAYIDRLIDDGFFEDFEDVLFYGSGAGGYAAAAYSVAAPGSRVLALRPQATLDPQIAGFDPRYRAQRRQDFTSRYGYAPDMIDAADKAYVAFDPQQTMDAVHAALFTRRNMIPLRCTAFGNKIDLAFKSMEIDAQIMRDAMDGSMTAASFGKLMRARRNVPAYLRGLYMQMVKRDRSMLAANVCAHAVRNGHHAFFADRLTDLQRAGFEPCSPVVLDAAE